MRKLLYILLGINILALCIGFFVTLSTSVIYAFVFLALGALGLVPLIALISCLDRIEKLEDDYTYLTYKIKRMEDTSNGNTDANNSEPAPVTPAENAKAVWECVKCRTVNKAGTSNCVNCKAEYSPFINPTDNPDKKKKISRWIKDK